MVGAGPSCLMAQNVRSMCKANLSAFGMQCNWLALLILCDLRLFVLVRHKLSPPRLAEKHFVLKSGFGRCKTSFRGRQQPSILALLRNCLRKSICFEMRDCLSNSQIQSLTTQNSMFCKMGYFAKNVKSGFKREGDVQHWKLNQAPPL
jgi:hypothetical protein